MNKKKKYCFIGFDDSVSKLIADKFYYYLTGNYENAPGTDFEIETAQQIIMYDEFEVSGFELTIKAKTRSFRKHYSIVCFSGKALLEQEKLAAVLSQDELTTELFFCFAEHYLKTGFDGFEMMTEDSLTPLPKYKLTELIDNRLLVMKKNSLIYVNSTGKDWYQPIFKLQNQGRRLSGSRLGLFYNEGIATDLQSFTYFLSLPVMVVDKDERNYCTLIN